MTQFDPFTIATTLLACALSGVDHTGDLAISRSCVVPGEIAWDNCQCGQLVITEMRRYPSSNFPLEEVVAEAECGEPWIVLVFSLVLTRCVPGPDNNGNPPSCTDLQNAAQQLIKDKNDIRRAVMCCLNAMFVADNIQGYQLGAQETLGPQGDCAGSDLQVLVGLLQPCEC